MLINVLFWKINTEKRKMFHLFVENKKQEIIWDIFSNMRKWTVCFTFRLIELLVSLTVKSAKPAGTCFIFPSGNRNQHWLFWWTMFCKSRLSRTAITKRRILFVLDFSPYHDPLQPNMNGGRTKSLRIWHERVGLPLVEALRRSFNYWLSS